MKRMKFTPIPTPAEPGDCIFVTVYLDPAADGLIPRSHTFMVEAHDANREEAIKRVSAAVHLVLKGLCQVQS